MERRRRSKHRNNKVEMRGESYTKNKIQEGDETTKHSYGETGEPQEERREGY